MKPTLQLLLTVFFCSCISLESCTLSDDPKPKTELEKLPPVTQEGKNTFGCLVNGKAWFTTYITDATSDYQLGSLQLSGVVDEPKFQSIGISLRDEDGGQVLTTGIYNLKAPTPFFPSAGFYDPPCIYGGPSNLDQILKGELTITKFDKINYIISGTFHFTVINPVCDTVRVTNGRFDIRYAP